MLLRYFLLTVLVCMCPIAAIFADDIGYIHVKCDPGFLVYLDGRLAGCTNADEGGLLIKNVAAGLHEVKACKDGFADMKKSVTVEKDQIAVVVFDIVAPNDNKGQPEPDVDTAKVEQDMRSAVGKSPIALVLVLPGSFMMGSEKGFVDESPVHKVSITRAFCIGKTEVTQKQYKEITGENPSMSVGEDKPVEQVSWDNAMDFCRKLSEIEHKKGNLPEYLEYRLPTEAEWEYCCRAKSDEDFCFGADETQLADYAWYKKNSDNSTQVVASKRPNSFGLHDMHGNVAEWCLDRYSEYSADEQKDPSGAAKGEDRIWRGGSFNADSSDCRSAIRNISQQNSRSKNRGFRIVLSSLSHKSSVETPANDKTDPADRALQARKSWIASAPLKLITVPAGAFMMGSEKGQNREKPVHRVVISREFYIGATEVTQAQYRAYMGVNPSVFRGDDLPVDMVSWWDAMEFCRRLTASEREKGNLPSGLVYRLPTEAEWEYCCRAGSTTEFCFGDGDLQLSEYAWFHQNSDSKTHPVATKKPNAWGIYDMHGNVAEWCLDWYSKQYSSEEQTDPQGEGQYLGRVYRGGAWSQDSLACRSANRTTSVPTSVAAHLGFRIVASPIPYKEK